MNQETHTNPMNYPEGLRFRRQFIGLPYQTDKFKGWQYNKLKDESFHFYSHPDLETTASISEDLDVEIVMFGFILDPVHPESRNIDILDRLTGSFSDLDAFSKEIANFAGRFALVIRVNDRKYAYHDAGGLRSVYYLERDGQVFLATQPSILSQVVEIAPSANRETYMQSDHRKKDIEYWIPCGLSLAEGVYQLIPNYFLDIAKRKQIRFWPSSKIEDRSLDEAVETCSRMLRQQVIAASNRFKLGIALTSGFDSRIILAASKGMHKSYFLHTMQFRNMTRESSDIKVPQSILKKIKVPHHVVECRTEPDRNFLEIYKNNVDLAHHDWSMLNYGMMKAFPGDHVLMKGNTSEIGRTYLFKKDQGKVGSVEEIISLWPDWKKIPFIMENLEDWFSKAMPVVERSGVHMLDLFFWEQRIGSWYAQNLNELDIVHDTFSPFSYRPMLEIMLGVPAKFRKRDSSVLHYRILETLWPELAYWPINPPNWNRRRQLKYKTAAILRTTGLYGPAYHLYKKAHPLYMKVRK